MLKIIFIIFSSFFIFSANAYAYLDPGSGASIIQIILGMFAAAASAVAFYWTKLKNYISRIFKKNNDKSEEKEKDENQSH